MQCGDVGLGKGGLQDRSDGSTCRYRIRRTILRLKVLERKWLVSEVLTLLGKEELTHSPPIRNKIVIRTFRRREMCSLHTIGIGSTKMMASVTMLSTVVDQ